MSNHESFSLRARHALVGFPGGSTLKHSVNHDNELSHTGDDGDLVMLTGGGQALRRMADDGLAEILTVASLGRAKVTATQPDPGYSCAPSAGRAARWRDARPWAGLQIISTSSACRLHEPG